MGPGARHGTMNDHFGHWNWVKLTRLGEMFFSVFDGNVLIVVFRDIAEKTIEDGRRGALRPQGGTKGFHTRAGGRLQKLAQGYQGVGGGSIKAGKG